MASFADDFADNLRSYLPGAFDEAVKVQFYDAAREFYRRSRSWVESFQVTPDMSGQVSLSPISDNADICYLEGIYSDRGYQQFWYPSTGPSRQLTLNLTGGGTAFATLVSPTELYLATSGDVSESFYLDVSLQPKLAVDYLPDVAVTHHSVGLKAGTLGHMMAQPAKPYTSGDASAFWLRKFEIEISRAREMHVSGYGSPMRGARLPVVPAR